MNIQPGRLSGKSKRPLATRSETSFGKFGIICRLVLVCLALAAVGNAHIYLMQKTAESGKRTRELKREMEAAVNDNTNLRNRKEALSDWKHIQSQIARFDLHLRPAMPGQVQPMNLYSPRQASMIPLTPYAPVASRGSKRYR